jgi:hypothetical protein
MHVKLDGCTGACATNKTAIFQIADDAGTTVLDTFCSAFEAFNEDGTDASGKVSAHFFYAFTLPSGNRGKYWMSQGCFLDGVGVGALDGNVYPYGDTTAFTSFTYEAISGGEQYANQPAAPSNMVLSTNYTDVYVPYLLLATPHSPDKAFESSSGFRTSQFKYVDASTELELFFSEPVTGQSGKSVYVYGFTPTQGWTAGMFTGSAAEAASSTTKDAATMTKGLLNTMQSTTLSLTKNRLYTVLIDAGAFLDAADNAAAGVNGMGSSYDSCVAVNTAPIGRNCLIQFVVPMDLSKSNAFPSEVTGSPVDLSQATVITKATNVVLQFPEAVQYTKVIGVASQLTFGVDGSTSADLDVRTTGEATCFDTGYAGFGCFQLFSSTYYIFEPQDYLADAVTTYNSTEVTVSFTTGTFDYVNAFSYKFLTNRTDHEGRNPAILAYGFGSNLWRGDDPAYYLDAEGNDAGIYKEWSNGVDTLVLYFDTKVKGQTGLYVTFTPLEYGTVTATELADSAGGKCFDTSSPSVASLAPCKISAAFTNLVSLTKTGTKATINPGTLIPGQTYKVSVDAGAFAGLDTGDFGSNPSTGKWEGVNGVVPAFETMFYVAHTGITCTVGDASSGPLHRTSSIVLSFTGPVSWASNDAAITVGGEPQHVSNPDVVYMRNNAAASTNPFMVIIEPRHTDGSGDAAVGMAADSTIAVGAVGGVISNFANGATAPQTLCTSYTTLYEDLVQPELLSVGGLTGAGVASKGEKYSFSNFDDSYKTTFTLSFSEKVVGAGTATLYNSAMSTKTFGLGGSGASSETSFAITDRTVTLTLASPPLDPGAWTLNVPYASLTDTATETGVPGNPFMVSASCAENAACMAAGADAATATVTVNGAGNTAPTCTVASSGVVQHSSADLEVIRQEDGSTGDTTTNSDRTLVLEFSEGVKIRDASQSIKMYASPGDVEVLSVNLATGVLTCAGGQLVCVTGTTTGVLEFDWLDGCSKSANGPCFVSDDGKLAGGGQYLFLFLQDLKYVSTATSYYFKIPDVDAIVTEYDFPVCGGSTKLGEFTVYDPMFGSSYYVPQVTLASSPLGPYDNLLVSFSEKVTYGTQSQFKVTFMFKETINASSSTDDVRNDVGGNQTDGVVLSASGLEAVVHVPYREFTNPSAFQYLTVVFDSDSFVDLALASENKTAATTAAYNSTSANAFWKNAGIYAGLDGTEDVKPQPLMMLPGGAVNNRQKLTGINTTATIYLIMSENVTITKSTGVKARPCGSYVVAPGSAAGESGYVNGWSSGAPLTNPSCADPGAGQSTTLTLVDNAYGSSVVQVSPTQPLKEHNKYLLEIAAATFTDQAATGNTNVAVDKDTAASSRAKFEFFTVGSRARPAVQYYEKAFSGSLTTASGTKLMDVWFDSPVSVLSQTESTGLEEAGSATSGDKPYSLACSGGFKCTISVAGTLAEDSVYLVNIPTDITDREGDKFAGAAAAVSFRTQLADITRPNVTFCSHVSVGSTSLSLKLGFTEAITLYGGYTTYTDSTNSYLDRWDSASDNVAVTMSLEAGGRVLHVESAAALTPNSPYELVIGASQIADAAGHNLAANILLNSSDAAASTIACQGLSNTLAAVDSTAPTLSGKSPAAGSKTAHNGDAVAFEFSEEVRGVATKTLTLTKCGPASTASSCGADGATVAETADAAAAPVYFGGNSNGLWQITSTLELGVTYKVSAAAGAFEDLSGNAIASAEDITFQVALENYDYRGDEASGAITRAETTHGHTVAFFESASGVSRLGINSVDTTVAQTLKLFFPQKVKATPTLKVYFNSTAGGSFDYFEVTGALTGNNALSLAVPADSLKTGYTYELQAYVAGDTAWDAASSADIFSDADTYYTYFGNYKGTSAYSASYIRPAPTRFTFTTTAATSSVYYNAPTLASGTNEPFSFRPDFNTPDSFNKTSNIATSAMVEVDVTTNGTLTFLSGAFTVHKAARTIATASTGTSCTGTFATCCSGSWSAVTADQSHYVDYAAINYAADPVVAGTARVYIALDGGFEADSCYRLGVAAQKIQNENDAGKIPSATEPDYVAWFMTGTASHAGDTTPPAAPTLTVSSENAAAPFKLVARSALLQLNFDETVTAGPGAITLNDGGSVSITPSGYPGSTVTLTPGAILKPGTVHTVSVGLGAVQDANGNYFSTTYSQTFQTVAEDTDTPTVLHALPESGDTASLNARMVLFMSERVAADGTKSATAGSQTVAMTQSTWHGFQDGTSVSGAVIVEDARVTFGYYGGLSDAASASVAADALVDQYGRKAGAKTVSFTAQGFGAFAEPTLAASPDYGGDAAAEVVGASAVGCGSALYLVGGQTAAGGYAGVSTWNGKAWTAAAGLDAVLGNRMFASVAASRDCTLWVVGGQQESSFVKSTDGGATFALVTPTPLPVHALAHGDETEAHGSEGHDHESRDGSELVEEGVWGTPNFAGAAVAVVNGWQVVICGGGLDKCWVCKDEACGVAGRSASVPKAVQQRYYGSMLVVDGNFVYFLGGQNGLATQETACHESAYRWDFFADKWEGLAAKIDHMDSAASPRCESAYAQAGDGMIVVVGGNNATAQTKGEYGIGRLSANLQAARPLLDSAAYVDGSTYAQHYANPVLFAYGPTSTALTAASSAAASEPVVLAFSEPVQAGTGCVEIDDSVGANGKLYCSAASGKCFTDTATTTSCAGAVGTTGVAVANTEVKIEGSIVTIGIGNRGTSAAATVTVTLNDNIVHDAMGNGFLKSKGSPALGAAGPFGFGFSAAPAAFGARSASALVSPANAASGVDLDTNLVFQFNRELSNATSRHGVPHAVLAGFSLTLAPTVGDSIVFNENDTTTLAFAGDILKVSLAAKGAALIPGMTYTATLAANSIQSMDSAAYASAVSGTFTARNGPTRGATGAGNSWDNAVLMDVPGPQNDTGSVPPTVVSVSPPRLMTGVATAAVHVVYTFSEAVTLTDARNQSNQEISDAFSLQFYNVSATKKADSLRWADDGDLALGSVVFVNTTGKTITVALSSLKEDTRYRVKFNSGVIEDFGETTSTKVWSSVSATLTDYEFTTVGSVTDASAPKVVASFATPLSSSGDIILGDDEPTMVHVVFDRPLDGASPAAGCVVGPSPGAAAAPECGSETNLGKDTEVLAVTIPDFFPSPEAPAGTTGLTYDLLLENAAEGHHFVNLTAMLPSLPKLSDSFPGEGSSATYDKYGADSTVVLKFSEDIQAGAGSVTLTATHDSAGHSRTFAVDDPHVTLVGSYLVIQPGDLMPGEEFKVSMTNGTVRGVTGRQGDVTSTYVAANKAFKTAAKIKFASASLLLGGSAVQQHGAAVAFGEPHNALVVIGGKRGTDAISNTTDVSQTYRDTDAAPGDDVPDRCLDPCKSGATRDVTESIYRSASTRGLRHTNANGVAQSVQGEALRVKAGSPCVCPVCIYRPVNADEAQDPLRSGDAIPANGCCFRDDATAVYTQMPGDGVAEHPLDCRLGTKDGLKEQDGYEQGYDIMENFTCTVGDIAADPVAEYFGVWQIAEDACAPKNCVYEPAYPADMFAGTDSACKEMCTDEACASYQMDHGQNCTVSCNPGYEKVGLFECDRGIYSNKVTCEKRMCTYTDAIANGALAGASEVEYKQDFTVKCDPGYEADNAASTCEADTDEAESTVGANLAALSCKIMSCANAPTDSNANVECTEGNYYKGTCAITCNAGYHYASGGSQTQSGSVECQAKEAEVEWEAAATCTQVKCELPSASAFATQFGPASHSATGEMTYGEQMTVTCDPGYSTDATNAGANSFKVTCSTDGSYASVLDGGGATCVPLNCATLESIAGSFATGLDVGSCDATTALPAGTTCDFTCGSGGKPTNADLTQVKCEAGTLIMIAGSVESPVVGDVCIPAAAKTVEQVVIRSSASLELAMSRRLASHETEGAIPADTLAEISTVFKKATAETLQVSVSNIEIEDITASINANGNALVVIQFYVEVESGSAAEGDLTASLQSLADGSDATLMATFEAAITSEMADVPALATFTVQDVGVSAPTKATIYLEDPTAAPAATTDEGGGGPVVIIVVVVIVLAVIGLVVWKFVLKK